MTTQSLGADEFIQIPDDGIGDFHIDSFDDMMILTLTVLTTVVILALGDLTLAIF